MHHNGEAHTYSNSAGWYVSMVFETICYWAVPVFFMLTGANLLDYRNKYSTRVFFQKRIKKVVIPWISWLVICAVLKYIKGSLVIDSLGDIVSGIINNDFMEIYWFFPAIIMVYLSLPVLSSLFELNGYRKLFAYMILMTFVFVDCMPYLLYTVGVQMNMDFLFPLDTGYLQYVLLGYLLSTCKDIKKKNCAMIYFLAVLMCILRYVVTVTSEADEFFFSYKSFHAFLLALGVFLLFKSMEKYFLRIPDAVNDWIRKLSECTMGVYLVHMIIIYQVVGKIPFMNKLYVWNVLAPIMTYLLSLAVVYALKKIPILRYIVP